jgi:hypothetical protein
MTKSKQQKKERLISDKDKIVLEEGWNDVGCSIARAIVEARKSPNWGWNLISMLGLYKRWMLTEWIERYKRENPPPPIRGKKSQLEKLRQKLKTEIEKTTKKQVEDLHDK